MQEQITNDPHPQGNVPLVKPQPQPFTFQIIKPFTSPAASSIPFVVDGLFRQGGLSSLVAKPKQGKSSLSRFAASCISKGKPFLGRDTVKGSVLLISIEDPTSHVDGCLKALNYNEGTDAPIYIVDRISTFTENIAALRQTLTDFPGITLVVIDTLMKFVMLDDVNRYDRWLPVFRQFKALLNDFPHVSILCLLHAKKVTGEDPFDAMLGSTALRGEFDCNTAIVQHGKDRALVAEVRIGRAIPPSLLTAELEDIDGSEVVQSFTLGEPVSEYEAEKQRAKEKKQKLALEEGIVSYLTGCKDCTALYKDVLSSVRGKTERVVAMCEDLIKNDVLITSGTKGVKNDPYKLTLDHKALATYQFLRQYGGQAPEEKETIQ